MDKYGYKNNHKIPRNVRVLAGRGFTASCCGIMNGKTSFVDEEPQSKVFGNTGI